MSHITIKQSEFDSFPPDVQKDIERDYPNAVYVGGSSGGGSSSGHEKAGKRKKDDEFGCASCDGPMEDPHAVYCNACEQAASYMSGYSDAEEEARVPGDWKKTVLKTATQILGRVDQTVVTKAQLREQVANAIGDDSITAELAKPSVKKWFNTQIGLIINAMEVDSGSDSDSGSGSGSGSGSDSDSDNNSGARAVKGKGKGKAKAKATPKGKKRKRKGKGKGTTKQAKRSGGAVLSSSRRRQRTTRKRM